MNKKGQTHYLRDGRAPVPEKEITSRVMRANKGRNTAPEIVLRKALWKDGIRGYRLHWRRVVGRPDIAFPKHKVAVFVHGCFWHRCPHCDLPLPKTHSDFWREKFERNKKRDKEKEERLQKDGWKVITIWECEIKKDIPKCLSKILRSLARE